VGVNIPAQGANWPDDLADGVRNLHFLILNRLPAKQQKSPAQKTPSEAIDRRFLPIHAAGVLRVFELVPLPA